MRSSPFSNTFLAAKVAGSCRLEGDEQDMCDIIAGKLNAAVLRRQIVPQYQSKNSKTLEVAAA